MIQRRTAVAGATAGLEGALQPKGRPAPVQQAVERGDDQAAEAAIEDQTQEAMTQIVTEAVEAGEDIANPPPVTVTIGSSMGSQTRCVQSARELDCAANAGDRGVRVNPDYATAGDRFSVTCTGTEVCASRLDNDHWGMNLQVRCPVAQPADDATDEASAVGDPHVTTRHGQKIDLDFRQRKSHLPALHCEHFVKEHLMANGLQGLTS